jgi:uncharacterized protein YndB with AHSA1/START domain
MDKTKVTKDLENNTLIIERVFDAPQEKLWRAYADREWFEAWWGPEGWQTTTKDFDFKVGGRIHYGMKCEDPKQTDWFGKTAWGVMTIEAIDEPHSFTASDSFCDADGTIDANMPTQKFAVELADVDGQTNLISRSVCDTAEQLEMLVKMGMAEGFASQLNRLETLLNK